MPGWDLDSSAVTVIDECVTLLVANGGAPSAVECTMATGGKSDALANFPNATIANLLNRCTKKKRVCVMVAYSLIFPYLCNQWDEDTKLQVLQTMKHSGQAAAMILVVFGNSLPATEKAELLEVVNVRWGRALNKSGSLDHLKRDW